LRNINTRPCNKNWCKSSCTVYFQLAQCSLNHCASLQYSPYTSIITAQIRYCTINIARVGAP
jgi:hypothetical protein